MTTSPIDLVASRQARALDVLRHSNVSRLKPDARLAYTVRLLICDDEGKVDDVQLEAALIDPDVRSRAAALLRKALS